MAIATAGGVLSSDDFSPLKDNHQPPPPMNQNLLRFASLLKSKTINPLILLISVHCRVNLTLHMHESQQN